MARVRVSIVFESGERIGRGKAGLLESIRDTGSISATARDIMGMSYTGVGAARSHQLSLHRA
jgi:molybdenum-dependent DNA-binding transcriptional regulator ModE